MSKIQELIRELQDTGFFSDEQLAQQVVGETVLAILATDTRDIVYTTYDQDQVQGIISRVVDQVRNHWGFK